MGNYESTATHRIECTKHTADGWMTVRIPTHH